MRVRMGTGVRVAGVGAGVVCGYGLRRRKAETNLKPPKAVTCAPICVNISKIKPRIYNPTTDVVNL